MTEEWRPVPGWGGLYEVSDHGRVRSLDRIVTERGGKRRLHRGRVRRLRPNENGYPVVTLQRADVVRKYLVHRLVALAFLGPCPDGLEVRHWNGDPSNARASNLLYGTKSDNGRDKRRHGTDRNVNKTHCPRNHPYDAQNTRMNRGRRYCRACQQIVDRARRAAAASRRAEAC